MAQNDNVIIMDGAGQEITGSQKVKSIRWVAGASSAAGNRCILTESSSGTPSKLMWESIAANANHVESDSNGGSGFAFHNGLRVDTLDAGRVYLYL